MRPKYNSYKIVAVFLAFIMLCTSATYSVDLHFCKGELKSFSLFGKAKPCYEKKVHCPHHAAKAATAAHSRCCNNETIVISDLDIDYHVPSSIHMPACALFITPRAFDPSKSLMPGDATFTNSSHVHYRPPLPKEDLWILYQTLLI